MLVKYIKLQLIEQIIRGVERNFDFIAANPLLARFIFNELYSYQKQYNQMTKAGWQAQVIDVLASATPLLFMCSLSIAHGAKEFVVVTRTFHAVEDEFHRFDGVAV